MKCACMVGVHEIYLHYHSLVPRPPMFSTLKNMDTRLCYHTAYWQLGNSRALSLHMHTGSLYTTIDEYITSCYISSTTALLVWDAYIYIDRCIPSGYTPSHPLIIHHDCMHQKYRSMRISLGYSLTHLLHHWVMHVAFSCFFNWIKVDTICY